MPYESIGDKLRRNRIAALKLDYETIRAAHPETKLKPYDELTQAERDHHEEVFNETTRFMAKLGKAIHDGTELPDPFGDH
jgi:hypothetical protein